MGGRKSSVFNGFGHPGAAPGDQKEDGRECPSQILLCSCRGERRALERGGNAFLQYPLPLFYDFQGARESTLRAF